MFFRKFNGKTFFRSTWTPLEEVASTVNNWLEGKDRPRYFSCWDNLNNRKIFYFATVEIILEQSVVDTELEIIFSWLLSRALCFTWKLKQK